MFLYLPAFTVVFLDLIQGFGFMASACISELHLELKTARRAVRLELDKTPVESYKIGVYERQVENLLEELKLHTLTAGELLP